MSKAPSASSKQPEKAENHEALEQYHSFTKEDRALKWFFQPHTLTGLTIGGLVLIYVAFTRETTDFESNTKYGLVSASLVFLLFSALQFRDGLFVRPHPIVWRVITGCGVLYLLALIFLLFQTVDDARQLMKKIDPALGVPLPERSYAEQCGTWKSFIDTVNDEFILAHLFGWFGKAFLFRDFYLCWVMSVLFEILEVSFEHMLPNFAECWWDHIILDIFVCNYLGFLMGMWVVNYFSMKPYSWIRPEFQHFEWGILKSWKNLVAVIALIVVINLVELNAFFLKFVLWIPPPHPLCIIRLMFWWGIGLPGCREYFQYCTDKNCKKLGPSSWLCLALACIELLICIKFGKGMFPKPHPPEIVWSWVAAAGLLFIWAIWWYGFRNPAVEKQKKKKAQ